MNVLKTDAHTMYKIEMRHPKAVARIKCLTLYFHEDWLSKVAREADGLMVAVGPGRTGSRKQARDVALGYIAWKTTAVGAYIMVLATEPWAAKRGIAQFLVAALARREAGAPMVAMALQDNVGFWEAIGFVSEQSGSATVGLRAALRENAVENKDLRMYVHICDGDPSRRRRGGGRCEKTS